MWRRSRINYRSAPPDSETVQTVQDHWCAHAAVSHLSLPRRIDAQEDLDDPGRNSVVHRSSGRTTPTIVPVKGPRAESPSEVSTT